MYVRGKILNWIVIVADWILKCKAQTLSMAWRALNFQNGIKNNIPTKQSNNAEYQ